jgi:hypothetical protein
MFRSWLQLLPDSRRAADKSEHTASPRENAPMKISDIQVGRRHRQHVGDVRSLAASIAKLGLLHPVVVDGNGRLVAGARRLAASRLLGWRDVPVRVVRNLTDAANALRAERDENTEREAFRPSEIVSIARRLEPFERAEARARLRHGGPEARAEKVWDITTRFDGQDPRQAGCGRWRVRAEA